MSPGKIVQLRVPRTPAPVEAAPVEAAPVEAVRVAAVGEPASATPLAVLSKDIEALEAVVGSWGEHERNVVKAFERALDALHKEAFTRLIRALKVEPAALAVLRNVSSDEVVYAVLRHHGILKASLQERVEEALASVRPELASHGGNVELNAIELPATVSVRLLGSCDGCSAAGLTMKAGVEKAITERCPEIQTVRVVSGTLTAAGGLGASGAGQGVRFVSPFAAAEGGGWLAAASLGDVPEGGTLALELAGHSLLLSRSGVQVSCFENACAHLGMPLDGGEVKGGVITCPFHGFQFSLESGECLTVPQVQLQTHAARVLGERVEVRFS
jgi:nitrite reductase/ring-hydroxylating ferredoxin subunit/Fe-S cluster biogenesis protein NfuA